MSEKSESYMKTVLNMLSLDSTPMLPEIRTVQNQLLGELAAMDDERRIPLTLAAIQRTAETLSQLVSILTDDDGMTALEIDGITGSGDRNHYHVIVLKNRSQFMETILDMYKHEDECDERENH